MPRLVKYFGHASQILKSTIKFVTGLIVRNCSLTVETECSSITGSSKSAIQPDELGSECTFVDKFVEYVI